jgi:hypothetical protein
LVDIDSKYNIKVKDIEGQLESLSKPADDLLKDLYCEKESMMRELEKIYKS